MWQKSWVRPWKWVITTSEMSSNTVIKYLQSWEISRNTAFLEFGLARSDLRQSHWPKLKYREDFLNMWRCGVVAITTAHLHLTKPELRFCAGSNPARGLLEIRDGEDIWQCSLLEKRISTFRRSTIPQKQFIYY